MTIAPGLSRCPTIVHALAAAVAQVPFLTALVCEERRLSYAELGRAVSGLARMLAALNARGERVVVLMPTSIEAVVSALAVLAAPAQLTPVDPSIRAEALEQILTEAEPCLIVCDATSRAALAELESRRALPKTLVWGSPELDASAWLDDDSLDLTGLELPAPDELALLLFTSGTTGAPRAAEHAHRGVALSLLQHCTCWPVASGHDRFLDVAPLFHVWGLMYSTFVPIYARATRVLVPHFDAERVLAAIEQHAISVFAGGPAAVYAALLASARFGTTDFSNLRHSLSNGPALPPELFEDWQRGTGRPLLAGWSLAEAAPLCLSDARLPGKPGSVGRAAPLTQISVVDQHTGVNELRANQLGQIRVRGPQRMLGYRDRPAEIQATLRDGWLYTGEIGYLDEDGHLFLVERGAHAPAFHG
jgi:long-chain acyl-CoA synthetase